MTGVHLLIGGEVQGVGFRWFVHAHAHRLGLVGFVRNRADGRVEVRAEGEHAQLESLIELCRQGPPYSGVEGVEVEWTPATGQYREFRIAS